MGQDLTHPSLQLQRVSSAKHTHNLSGTKMKSINENKILLIIADNEEFSIQVNDDTLTCGWLISEILRLYKGIKTIVGLRTSKNLEALDYWLMHFERSLQPFKSKETLIAVFEEPPAGPFGPCHFTPIKFIGKGGFSQVVEVRKKDTGMLYAVKIIKKDFLINEDKVHQILTEKSILINASHPFIVKLHWSYQTDEDLHLIMDFCPGGELFYHLHNLGRLAEDQARFYISEIVVGLEFLHGSDVIYRDLKPENILLDLDGHIKITDFGLSKQFIQKRDKSFSFCGSPEYMSPEMLKGQGHGREVDFYSLGALLFEMLTGLPPFYDSNRSRMYRNILQNDLFVPNYISKAGKDLIYALLNKNPEQRLGYHQGTTEIKSHPWFKGISWNKVLNKKTIPPYRPNFRHSNFDPEYLTMQLSEDEFKKQRIPSTLQFANFDHNVEDKGRISETSNISTQSSKHATINSQVTDEYNSTKVKLFMPTVSPKICAVKDPIELCTYRHRRYREMMPMLLSGEVPKTSRNLVQELKSTSNLRVPFRQRRKDKPLSQELNLEIPETNEDKYQANQIPEFLKKVEVSKITPVNK